MIEQPLCPRLEAQIHRVLSAFQKAWKMNGTPEEPKVKRPQRPVSEPKRTKVRLAPRPLIQQEVIAYIQANPSAKQEEILREVGCDRKTLWRARQKLKVKT